MTKSSLEILKGSQCKQYYWYCKIWPIKKETGHSHAIIYL